MPLIELAGKYASTKVKQIRGLGRAAMTPLHRWARKDGLATFLRDMIDLRKTLALCSSCLHKMPFRWKSRYVYESVRGFPANARCDYCRQDALCGLFVAGEGAYWAEFDRGNRSVRETRERERVLRDKDYRHIPF